MFTERQKNKIAKELEKVFPNLDCGWETLPNDYKAVLEETIAIINSNELLFPLHSSSTKPPANSHKRKT